MGPEFEKAIHELSLRMRMIRAVQEGDSQDSLNEREALILQQLLERDVMTVSEIAQSWPNVSESTISMTITRLWREKGLVSKTINPKNQRVTIIKLTEKGRQEIQKWLKQQGERFNALFHAINVTPEEKEVMIRICERGSRFLDQYLGTMKHKTD
jgi:DNA-binding MarR family transcriptional regulator